ncbi:MAG TPA: amino acid permease [Candidatus Cybelea sp.]|nr:amino acid permease [Candidatus Cybelea sp.]
MKRAIDLRGAVSINVITMIGIGPLVTIPLVIAALGGPLALVGWIAGAIVALCDGMVWAELSSQFPGSGGTYVYLRNVFGAESLGRALAFLFNWQFLLYAPCLLASGYIGFANYAAYLYPPLANGAPHDLVAVAIGGVTMLLLYRRTSQVSALSALLAVAATATVALVALAGLSHADFTRAFHLSQPIRFGAGLLAGFGTALYITLYDYVGYADVALLGDEVIRPRRTIPLSILLSVLLVAILYVLLQIGVLGVVPWQSLLDSHGQPTAQAQYVGAFVVEHTWGRFAALAVTLLVLVTAFASLYGNLLGFSRISFAAARDGAFLPAFAKLHPRKEIPHVALLAVGGLSLIASFFTLDQVIAFLTAGIVLIQGVAQVFALFLLRWRKIRAPFRMPLYPLPAIVALAGWSLAFASSGTIAIALGLGWLGVGAVVFLVAARKERWWPFLALLLISLVFPAPAPAASSASTWSTWNTSRVTSERGYPVFAVDGKPFFVYGAAFFYERIPRDRWRTTLAAYKSLGINTIDLYLIWNWHEPAEGVRDFTGATDPRRDVLGLLKLTHEFGFKLILRPGPVIRNEWRNGGYPAWLLQHPQYNMPLYDILEGRYPATATLQNSHADAAAAEWLANAQHLGSAGEWLTDVLRCVEPYSRDVIAIALDDDQGAYLDNDTWPAPHWHAYVDWLRGTVASVVGSRVPLFINTYEMKVPSASPAWAWGNWYQSDAYRIGEHDLSDLDFATGLLQTQSPFPVMQSEFQAGWLQGADEGAPRPSDPTNTAIALAELLRDGAHGIVNFPVQDTVAPHGWEAPWANWSYAWDAALTVDLRASPRYAPTRAIGDLIRRYGAALAKTHVAADASIIWPPSMFVPGSLSNADFTAFADATIAMQRDCNARGLTSTLVDLRTLSSTGPLLLPVLPSTPVVGRVEPWAVSRLQRLRQAGRLLADPSAVRVIAGGRRPPWTTLLLGDSGGYGFLVAVNPGGAARRVGRIAVLLRGRAAAIAPFTIAARSVRVIPVGISAPAVAGEPVPRLGSPPPFSDPDGTSIGNARLRVVFAPFAGARIAELGNGKANAATSIGLLRDAVDPEPRASSRDYIAAYTHPVAAGTFNRPYACTRNDVLTTSRIACSYDAPDLPQGGAIFTRTLTLGGTSDELVVDETFAPHDAHSPARLESISGFAFALGDALLKAPDGDALGVLHGRQLTALRWRRGDVARVDMRTTRGAELVTLIFARRSVEMRLGVQPAQNAAEAQRLLDAKQR